MINNRKVIKICTSILEVSMNETLFENDIDNHTYRYPKKIYSLIDSAVMEPLKGPDVPWLIPVEHQ